MSVGQSHVSAKFVSLTTQASLAALWASDTIKAGFMTNAVPPTITDSDPRWGAGGSQNYATNEVTPGGNYSAGGVTLAGTTSTLSGANILLNLTSPIVIAANASNPTNAAWIAFYDSTDAGKHIFGYMDLGGVTSLVAGIQVNINGQPSGTQPLFQATAT